MKRFKLLIPAIPLIFALFLIIRGYLIYLIFVQPKLNELYEIKISLLENNDLIHNYGHYFIVFTFILVFLTVITLLMFFRKKEYNTLLFLVIFSLISIYSVNILNSITSVLTIEVLYEDCELRSSRYLEKLRDDITECGCLECVQELYKKH